ncbi:MULTISPECIES: hypothetical protein [Klebsiella pneumoniae complex]|uniref:hypothetical protein n=1 Tax=Klebsiella pneumoniae complex TaxID=3390273 RepID=UPI0022B74F15|nr:MULTISPECIES: hypothetical protein [Klebsiella]MCZ7737947.1 hypothetical protein [Klebsiella pneumoniae]MDZ2609638.1 hypothetical protein [Klebsiella variicola]
MKKNVIPSDSPKREMLTTATPYGQSNAISKEEESVRKEMINKAFSNSVGCHFDMRNFKK